MWNLRFQLPFAPRPQGSDAADPIDPEFEQLVAQSLCETRAPDALRARVAEACRTGLEARGTTRRLQMPLGKLGYAVAAGTVLLVVAPFLSGRNRGGAAFAEPAPTPGQLAVVDGKGNPTALCPLKHTDVHADVKGYVARVTVEQRFHNPSSSPVEAVYTFPLPEDAAVDDMTIRVGDRLVVGQIKRREEARQIYEAARDAGQTAALLDQERPKVFTQSVANLMPGTDVVVHISYVNLLKYDDGGYELVYPMVVGPRFIPGSGGYQAPGLRGDPSPARQVEPNPGTNAVVTDADKITPPITPPNTRAGHDISVTVSVDAGLPIEGLTSTLHAVDVERQGADRAIVRLKDQNSIPNKDFILRYTVAGKEIRSAVLADQAADGSGYFTLMVQPPAEAAVAKPDTRELVFVIDQTGSQSGWPIQKAKETMRYLIRNMNPDDSFQLLGFNTEVYPCFQAPVHNTPENVARALRFLDPLEAEGGTDILKAVEYALAIPPEAGRRRLICYLTDGYVGDDMQVVDYVKKHGERAYMFPFGIGDSVNRFLLEGMAKAGQGSAEFVTLQSSAEQAAARFYRRVARPLVTHLRVEWNGLPVQDVLPSQIPDLFVDGRPVILKGRYTRAAEGDLVLRGELDGRPWSHTMHVTLPARRVENSPLPTLWAREKIETLQSSDYLGAQTGNPNEEITRQIIGLALDYRLMSQYTSFVAVEQRVVNVGGKQRTVDVPVEMPEGVDYQGVFGEGGKEADGRIIAEQPSGAVATDGFSSSADGTNLVNTPGAIPAPVIGDPKPRNEQRYGNTTALDAPPQATSSRRPAPAPMQNLERRKQLPLSGMLDTSKSDYQVYPEPAAPPVLLPAPKPAAAQRLKLRAPQRNPFTETEEVNGVIRSLPAMPSGNKSGPVSAVVDRDGRSLPPLASKLAPGLQALALGVRTKVAANGAVEVRNGRVEVQLWLSQLPKDGLAKLKALGFDLAAELTPGKLLLGTVLVEKLQALAALDWVRRVEPPKYR
jgi:Ca-activated chloride channel family protein